MYYVSDTNTFVPSKFIPNSQTVNKIFYLKVWECLYDTVRKRCLELWQIELHHDKTPAHKALSMKLSL